MLFWKKKKDGIKKGPALSCVSYGICSKEKCHLWTTFDKTVIEQETKKPKIVAEGMCAFKWLPRLMIETRDAIDRNNHGLHPKPSDTDKGA